MSSKSHMARSMSPTRANAAMAAVYRPTEGLREGSVRDDSDCAEIRSRILSSFPNAESACGQTATS